MNRTNYFNLKISSQTNAIWNNWNYALHDSCFTENCRPNILFSLDVFILTYQWDYYKKLRQHVMLANTFNGTAQVLPHRKRNNLERVVPIFYFLLPVRWNLIFPELFIKHYRIENMRRVLNSLVRFEKAPFFSPHGRRRKHSCFVLGGQNPGGENRRKVLYTN